MEPVRRIVLGITGGIAAYKMPQLVRLLQKQGIDVATVLTPNARSLVGEEALRVLSGHPVYTDDKPAIHDMAHIELAKWAQYLLVCPATANTIAKLAHGFADNLLSTLALSFENRLIVAPAMNTHMWGNAATKENCAQLSAHNTIVLPVDSGELACGDEGAGRLLPLEDIVDHVLSAASPKTLAGKKVLLSSGPTVEPIDAVRVLSNRSSGRMGAALARSALFAGAEVCVVTGPARVSPPAGCRILNVNTTLEMKNALEAEFDNCDICIMAAAVSDFTPKEVVAGKKHRENSDTWNIECVANPDIAKALGAKKTQQFLVGFSLEADGADESGRTIAKMRTKNCDMMVANTVEASLETKTTSLTIFTNSKDPETVSSVDKTDAAEKIISRIAQAAKSGDSHV